MQQTRLPTLRLFLHDYAIVSVAYFLPFRFVQQTESLGPAPVDYELDFLKT